MKKLNIKEKQMVASKLLKVDIAIIESSSFIIPETELLYVSLTEDDKTIPTGYKGGFQLIVADDEEVLFCNSTAFDYNRLCEEFKNGRRTPLSSFKNFYVK